MSDVVTLTLLTLGFVALAVVTYQAVESMELFRDARPQRLLLALSVAGLAIFGIAHDIEQGRLTLELVLLPLSVYGLVCLLAVMLGLFVRRYHRRQAKNDLASKHQRLTRCRRASHALKERDHAR